MANSKKKDEKLSLDDIDETLDKVDVTLFGETEKINDKFIRYKKLYEDELNKNLYSNAKIENLKNEILKLEEKLEFEKTKAENNILKEQVTAKYLIFLIHCFDSSLLCELKKNSFKTEFYEKLSKYQNHLKKYNYDDEYQLDLDCLKYL